MTKSTAPPAAKKKTTSNSIEVKPAAKSSAMVVKAGKTALPKKQKTPKLQDIFGSAGFKHIPADNIHFKLQERTGEIDHIFVWENVVLLCEETAGKDVSTHCTKKIFFHRLIADDWPGFFETYRTNNKDLDAYIGTTYRPEELEVRHIYYSEEHDVDQGVVVNADPFQILSRAHASYFSSLTKTIARSAKYEILKFLGVTFNRVGKARISGSGVSSQSFPGFALPAAHTNYPKGFAVVSFYADPMSLIQRAYVLRRDGWENPDLSYQRFVRADKLIEMRDYLSNNGKVFINNLIVTLPSKALLRGKDGIVNPNVFTQKTYVELELPLELGTVGIVDGQHRILAYFEGDGPLEKKIEPLRERQNLLVTGIIFAPNYTPDMRLKFEAELFLAINNTQTGVNTQLRQDLETIINPETPLAIARSIVNRLSHAGPLEGMMQMSQFDPPEKIAAGSLGPYVVKPLTQKGSALFKSWDPTGVRNLADVGQRQEYIDYCVAEINKLLVGARHNLLGKWKPSAQAGVLSTTAVGGLILLLGRFATVHKTTHGLDFPVLLKPLEKFDFSVYTGSSWGKLSKNLFAEV